MNQPIDIILNVYLLGVQPDQQESQAATMQRSLL